MDLTHPNSLADEPGPTLGLRPPNSSSLAPSAPFYLSFFINDALEA